MINSKTSILLFGFAGSGKGTQGEILCNKFSFLHISPGDLLRQAMMNNTAPKTIIDAMNRGQLVNSEDVARIVADTINQESASECRGFVFDGFPRNSEQDTHFRSLLSENDSIDMAILFDVTKEDLLVRLKNRIYCKDCNVLHQQDENKNSKPICVVCGGKNFKHRPDDLDLDAINSRFDIFEKETMKIVEKFSKTGLLHKVNASQSINEVAMEVEKIVTHHIRKV